MHRMPWLGRPRVLCTQDRRQRRNILRTERLDYTGPESEEGYICQKGVAAARQPYNPDRVQGPMKRVGARGKGKWERISWDQALDEIAAKLLELRDKYGADSVAL